MFVFATLTLTFLALARVRKVNDDDDDDDDADDGGETHLFALPLGTGHREAQRERERRVVLLFLLRGMTIINAWCSRHWCLQNVAVGKRCRRRDFAASLSRAYNGSPILNWRTSVNVVIVVFRHCDSGRSFPDS